MDGVAYVGANKSCQDWLLLAKTYHTLIFNDFISTVFRRINIKKGVLLLDRDS